MIHGIDYDQETDVEEGKDYEDIRTYQIAARLVRTWNNQELLKDDMDENIKIMKIDFFLLICILQIYTVTSFLFKVSKSSIPLYCYLVILD